MAGALSTSARTMNTKTGAAFRIDMCMLLPKALPCVDTYATDPRADCHAPTIVLASRCE